MHRECLPVTAGSQGTDPGEQVLSLNGIKVWCRISYLAISKRTMVGSGEPKKVPSDAILMPLSV